MTGQPGLFPKPGRYAMDLLKVISDRRGELSDGDLLWAVRMEDAFRDNGTLTSTQVRVLESIKGRLDRQR